MGRILRRLKRLVRSEESLDPGRPGQNTDALRRGRQGPGRARPARRRGPRRRSAGLRATGATRAGRGTSGATSRRTTAARGTERRGLSAARPPGPLLARGLRRARPAPAPAARPFVPVVVCARGPSFDPNDFPPARGITRDGHGKGREYTFPMTVIEAAERHQELIDELIETVAAYNQDVDRDLLSARLRLRRERARRAAAPLGRGLHPPPLGRREDLRRAPPRRADDRRRAAARRRRGHGHRHQGGARRVRRRDRAARRGRDEADADPVPEPRAGRGRELPQDDRRDGAGRARDPDQARRPAPQHAHDRVPGQAEAGAEGQGDARGLRAARPPARDQQAQVGARGPRLRDAAPAQVRGDQGDGQRAPRRPRGARARGGDDAAARAREGRHPGRHRRPREALLFDLRQDGQEGPRVQRDLRPDRDAGDRGAQRRGGRARLLRRARADPLALEADARPLQGLRRDAEAERLPGAAHDGRRPRGPAARDPGAHARDARDGRVRRRRALGLQERQEGRQGRRGVARLDPPADGLAGGRDRPARVPQDLPHRPLRRRGLRLHAEGRGQGAAVQLDADRLRLRRAHRRRPPHRRREDQRPHRAAALPAEERRLRRDPDHEDRPRPVARLDVAGGVISRAQQDPAVVLARDARGDRGTRAARRSRRR